MLSCLEGLPAGASTVSTGQTHCVISLNPGPCRLLRLPYRRSVLVHRHLTPNCGQYPRSIIRSSDFCST
ncbi:hypothetical protein VUR80DRAFT_9570 [Thermomyces stellatus]